jgi:predicted Co/Zn/Cd cation transporter (cation efflux family)
VIQTPTGLRRANTTISTATRFGVMNGQIDRIFQMVRWTRANGLNNYRLIHQKLMGSAVPTLAVTLVAILAAILAAIFDMTPPRSLSGDQMKQIESRALSIGVAANLLMAVAGLAAAALSHSQAVQLDGLFSLLGAVSIWVARRVSARADASPDRFRPLGYAADEAIFTTFRALLLLTLVVLAGASASVGIVEWAQGTLPPPVQFEPLIPYFIFVSLMCFTLWIGLYWTWRKTGRKSDILQLEAKAAAFDGLLTLVTAAGMGVVYAMQDGSLAFIAPIGDRVLVLGLCVFAIIQYWKDFVRGLAELAGITAAPETVATVRRAIRAPLLQTGGKLIDLTVTKLGRQHVIIVFYAPEKPVSAKQADQLFALLQGSASRALPGASVWVNLSEHGRSYAPDIEQNADAKLQS